MIRRKADWVECLSAYLLAHQAEGFKYGTLDCCSFVCDAIVEMTGTDVYEEFRNKYTTKAGADEVMTAACGSSDLEVMVEHITQKFEMEEVLPHLACRGDVVLLVVDGGFALGLVGLDGLNANAVAAEGLHRVPMSCASRAWRV